ncbi:MAG: LptF/LptG family permease [Kiritimatiellia bacterium]
MTILPRYILREFLFPFLYCLTGFLSAYMLFDTLDSAGRIIDAKPPASLVLNFMAGRVAIYLEWLLPACLMLATLYTMWQLCRNSEITAMRANGVSFLSITWPILAFALLASLLCAANNEFYAPRAGEKAELIRHHRFKSRSAGTLSCAALNNPRANRAWSVAEIDLDAPRRLKGVKLSFSRPDGSKLCDLTAAEANFLDGVWWFSAPSWQHYDELNTPLATPNPGHADGTTTLLSLPELDERPEDFSLQNKRASEFCSSRDLVRFLTTNPQLSGREKASIRYELWKKLALPLASLVITLIAIPAGVATGRQSVAKGIIFAISLFFAFYLTVTLCMMLAKREAMNPALAAFLPDLIFLAAGVELFRRQR